MDSSNIAPKGPHSIPYIVILRKRIVPLLLVQYIRTTRTILLNPIALFCFLLAIRKAHHLYFLPVVLEFRWILSSGLSSQASGKRRTVTIAQEVKGQLRST